jgi:hypothetical protein
MASDNAYRIERHFGAPGWLAVLWQDYRRAIGCDRLPCDHVVCRMFREAELAEGS